MGLMIVILQLLLLPFGFLFWLWRWWLSGSTFAERNRTAHWARRLTEHLSPGECKRLNEAAVASGKRYELTIDEFSQLYDCACDLLDQQCLRPFSALATASIFRTDSADFELDDVIRLIDRRAKFCALLNKAA